MSNSVNRETLANLRALAEPGEPDPLVEFIDMFFTDTPMVLQRLHDSVKAGDASATREAAHSLKGSSSNLGAEIMWEYCKELEMQAKDGLLDNAERLLAQIEAEYSVVKEILETERQASSG